MVFCTLPTFDGVNKSQDILSSETTFGNSKVCKNDEKCFFYFAFQALFVLRVFKLLT